MENNEEKSIKRGTKIRDNNEQTKPLQRPKMSVEQRAKQFMPFAAVTGLEKALREKEKEIEERGVYERV